jgi:hypothetical protein
MSSYNSIRRVVLTVGIATIAALSLAATAKAQMVTVSGQYGTIDEDHCLLENHEWGRAVPTASGGATSPDGGGFPGPVSWQAPLPTSEWKCFVVNAPVAADH